MADQLRVTVDRGRVWIVRGVQSFMLAYDSDVPEELEWYAAQLRGVLGLMPKAEASRSDPTPLPPAPHATGFCEMCGVSHQRPAAGVDTSVTGPVDSAAVMCPGGCTDGCPLCGDTPATKEDPPCGHMLRGVRKPYCARCQRAAAGTDPSRGGEQA